MRILYLGLLWVATMLWAAGAQAGAADVVNAQMAASTNGMYRFDVTIRSRDTGWDGYADAWRIESPDGTVLGTRTLAHPHVNEQPFTRSLSGVKIPTGVKRVTIRAHYSKAGWAKAGWDGEILTITVP